MRPKPLIATRTAIFSNSPERVLHMQWLDKTVEGVWEQLHWKRKRRRV
ncbi:hypothetical protein CEV32_1540 [Brucella rhizosphaerae]|uniref:Uncharacterized protein n=1 Tax=Brucella rhizosphaerae TaxID=571254 RepID=A0A256F8S7_9HYPH|nr:hypothetical protein CEV32_1540 [Brucella rhizosphaerae]